eukprot:361050-Chlamydomonas_euryale.AAC.2
MTSTPSIHKAVVRWVPWHLPHCRPLPALLLARPTNPNPYRHTAAPTPARGTPFLPTNPNPYRHTAATTPARGMPS